MERYAIGMDLGGTNLKGGIVSEGGTVLERRTTASRVLEGPDRVLENLTSMADELVGKARGSGLPIDGIAVVTPGVVDPVFGGIVGGAENLPGWERIPFMRSMHERFGLPVSAHNDVTAHVLGEMRYGEGKGSRNVVMASFGTGIGGGIVVDGAPYGGAIGYAGEIGHMAVHAGGHLCACGIRGCWEEYASIRGILRIAREMMGETRPWKADGENPGYGLLKRKAEENRGELDPSMIFDAAREGDQLASAIVDEIGREAAIGIGGLINIFNPEIFIIGGGIASAGEVFFDAVMKRIPEWALRLSLKSVKVVPARLGKDAGIIGGAVLAFERINTYGGG